MLTIGGILLGCGLLTFAGLSYFGYLNNQQTAQQPSREGMVKVPKTQRVMTALSKVRREDVHNRELGDDSYFWFDKERVEQHPEWILNPSDIINRVMARDKEADLVFTEKDFLPKGSRTGLSAGIPDNKQGFFVDATKIPGLELLKMGDTFDLLASLPEEAQEQPEAEYGLLAGGIKVRGGKPIPLSGVRLLAQGAEMVAITRGRDTTTQGVMNLPEQDARTRRRDETTQITIAIDPKEVVPLTQALAAERDIHCVAGSGQNAEQAINRQIDLTGLIAFPGTARSMTAYTRITADDLADADTGEPRVYYFEQGQSRDEWLSSVNDLIGRVVAHDTTNGFIFTENDLLPPSAVVQEVKAFTRIKPGDLADPLSAASLIGRVVSHDVAAGETLAENQLLSANSSINTINAYSRILPTDLADPVSAEELIGRVAADDIAQGTVVRESSLLPKDAAPGISGGTPAGRMAISVSKESVTGIMGLGRGEHFDLVASIPFKPGESFVVLGADIQISSGVISQSELKNRARNTVLAENAIVVDSDESTATIAVRPNEVAVITKAITLDTSIFALARSGRTSSNDAMIDDSNNATRLKSDPDPLGTLTLVEEIVGGEHQIRVFAKGNEK